MLFIKSKIQFFESKSQLGADEIDKSGCCLSSQRYNFLKANHNLTYKLCSYGCVVYQVKDTIFWKQITTEYLKYSNLPRCLSSQRYNFLKANHNMPSQELNSGEVVYQVKDTIFWKQITTWEAFQGWIIGCLSSQRYNFLKANHNYVSHRKHYNRCCLSSQRYNFLKANHNRLSRWILILDVVYQVKDTIFWKQITTISNCNISFNTLFIKSKIQFFESKSQLRLLGLR